mgnify:CR=1 FL=1
MYKSALSDTLAGSLYPNRMYGPKALITRSLVRVTAGEYLRVGRPICFPSAQWSSVLDPDILTPLKFLAINNALSVVPASFTPHLPVGDQVVSSLWFMCLPLFISEIFIFRNSTSSLPERGHDDVNKRSCTLQLYPCFSICTIPSRT